MPIEEWFDTPQAGDVLSRSVLLDEIKRNLVAVLNDYKGLGIENEAALIVKVNALFTGDVIPSRTDWNTLVLVLKELSTVKEQGNMYNEFIADVSDSLGISDLKKIQDFLDYIQSLPPIAGQLSVVLEQPPRYYVNSPITDSTTNSWVNVQLNWSLSSNYLAKPKAILSLLPSPSEDIDRYEVTVSAGTFAQTYTILPTQPMRIELTLDWLSWFNVNELDNVYLRTDMVTYDKRGNSVSVKQTTTYPSSVNIPQGVARYEIEYRIDNSGWKSLGQTTATSYRWATPKLNGSYRYRVRAHDKNGATYGGFEGGNKYVAWSYSNPRYLSFLPKPPDKPNPKVSTTWKEATVTWAAVPRAEFYEIWHGGEGWAKDNTKNGNTYWKRIKSTDKREVKLGRYNEGKQYTFYIRAINAGGQNIGQVNATMKKRTLKTRTYNQVRPRVWNTAYERINKNKRRTKNAAKWKSTNKLYQGEWVDADWGGGRWYKRAAGSYWAYGGQQWGNHMSFIFFDYGRMRNDLRGKEIQSATISLSRASGSAALNAHGHKQATPLYLYNHNRDDNTSTSTANAFTLFRHDGRSVDKNTQQSIGSAIFNRGEVENFTNSKTKNLVKNIVEGRMRGLGIAKYYGSYLGTHAPVADKAYMILNANVKITVKYYEEN